MCPLKRTDIMQANCRNVTVIRLLGDVAFAMGGRGLQEGHVPLTDPTFSDFIIMIKTSKPKSYDDKRVQFYFFPFNDLIKSLQMHGRNEKSRNIK